MKSTFNRTALLAALMLLAVACAGQVADESVLKKNDAVEDYIIVGELESVDKVRSNKHLSHQAITDKYLVLKDGKKSYLLVFRQPCWRLDERPIQADRRAEVGVIRARFETFRGCRISHLYNLTPGQAEELLALGDKD